MIFLFQIINYPNVSGIILIIVKFQVILMLVDHIVHGILQARTLEWVAFPFSRGSSQPRDRTQSPALQVDSLPAEPQEKPKNTGVGGQVSRIAGRFSTS